MNSKPQKIIMLGQTNVGKTAILQTLINGKYPQKTSNTLGSSFHSHQLIDSDGEKVRMDLWDTAGQQKYRSLLTLYYKNSDGVIITFDLTNNDSFEAVQYWTKQIQQNCQSPPCIILVGNKSDLLYDKSINKAKIIDDKIVNKFLSNKKNWKYLTCSAKQNKNIKKIFETMLNMIKKKRKSDIIQQRNSKLSKKQIKLSTASEYKQSGCC